MLLAPLVLKLPVATPKCYLAKFFWMNGIKSQNVFKNQLSYWTRRYYCCQGPNFECWHNRFSMELNIKDIIKETDLPGSLTLSSKFYTRQCIVAGLLWLILDPMFLLEGQIWYLIIQHKTRTLGSYTSLFMFCFVLFFS